MDRVIAGGDDVRRDARAVRDLEVVGAVTPRDRTQARVLGDPNRSAAEPDAGVVELVGRAAQMNRPGGAGGRRGEARQREHEDAPKSHTATLAIRASCSRAAAPVDSSMRAELRPLVGLHRNTIKLGHRDVRRRAARRPRKRGAGRRADQGAVPGSGAGVRGRGRRGRPRAARAARAQRDQAGEQPLGRAQRAPALAAGGAGRSPAPAARRERGARAWTSAATRSVAQLEFAGRGRRRT